MFYECTQRNSAWFLYALDFPGMQLLSALRETIIFCFIWNFTQRCSSFWKITAMSLLVFELQKKYIQLYQLHLNCHIKELLPVGASTQLISQVFECSPTPAFTYQNIYYIIVNVYSFISFLFYTQGIILLFVFKHYVYWSIILDHNSISKTLGSQICFRFSPILVKQYGAHTIYYIMPQWCPEQYPIIKHTNISIAKNI